MKIHPLALALWAALAAAPALAGDDCDVPVDQWRSRDAVMQMAAQRGWQVQRLKIDDGCYEIRGRDAQGREFKAKLDPRTLEPVKMKLRDRDRDRDRDQGRDRNRNPGTAPTAGGSGASVPAPALKPGTTPRATIE
ncbi:MAG TPA: PepSY domain-containing protein [Rubrivivax sp.]|nr:PepSY domain-containing protein [Rubrivivax sp.]